MKNHQRTLCAAVATIAAISIPPAFIPAGAATVSQDQDDAAVLRSYHAGNGFLSRGLNELAAKEYRAFLDAHADHPRAPTARYGLAVALYRMKDYKSAAAELERIDATVDFEFAAETSLLLGQARMATKSWSEAAAALARVVADHPAHDLADDAAALLAEARYRAGDYNHVSDACEFIERHAPKSPGRDRAELFGGLSAMQMKAFGEAVDRFERLLDRSPDGTYSDRASLLLARCYQREGDSEAAARQYRDVLDRSSGGAEAFAPEALYALGGILRRQGEADDAGAYLDRLIEEHGESNLVPLAHLERGRVSFDAGDYERAREHFQAAAELAEQADQAMYWAAKCDLRLGAPADAAQRLGEAIASHPESSLRPEMEYDQAVALLRADRPEDAIDAFRGFRRAFPDHSMAPEALRLMAFTAHRLENYEQSAQWCDEFLEAYPDHAGGPRTSIEFLRAENEFLAGDLERAVDRYEAFLQQHADHDRAKEARFRLAMGLHRLEQHDEARAHLEATVKALGDDPQYRSAILALGDVYFRAGEWGKAADRMEQYFSFGSDAPNADDSLIKLGLARHRQGRHDDALRAYERLLQDHLESPHRLQAMFERAQAVAAVDRVDDAMAAFEDVLEEGGDSRFRPHALNHLGSIAMRREAWRDAARYFGELSEFDAAEPDLRGEALFQHGQALMAMDDYDAASDAFARLAEEHPDHGRADLSLANRALCLARAGEHQRALEAIATVESELADAIDPSLLTSLRYEKAWSLRALGEMDDAAATYRTMLEGAADGRLRRFARVELAELVARDDDHQAAIELLRPLQDDLDELPGDLAERAAYRYGVSLYELEEFDAAAEALDAFVERHPEGDLTTSARLLAGESLFTLKKHQQAIEHLKRIAEAADDPKILEPALLRLGEAEAALQHWANSEAAFQRHLERFEDSKLRYQALFGVAWARENQGRYPEAIEMYRTVIDTHDGPTAARSQFQVGECLFAQKKFEDAAAELMKVDILYAYPEWSAAALYEAGRCFEAMRQTAQAKAQFEAVQEKYADTKWAELAGERLTAHSRSGLPGRGE